MPRSSRALALVVAGLLAAIGTAAMRPTAVFAHTFVGDTTPGPGETVSGPVDRVVIEFLGQVVPTPDITVVGPGGEPVTGLRPAVLAASGDRVERRFDPLVEPGTYQVDYVYVSIDGDRQRGAQQFRFDPSGDGGSVVGGGAVIGAVTVTVVALGAVVVGAVIGRRRTGRGARQTDP